jgi:hypothetical protein
VRKQWRRADLGSDRASPTSCQRENLTWGGAGAAAGGCTGPEPPASANPALPQVQKHLPFFVVSAVLVATCRGTALALPECPPVSCGEGLRGISGAVSGSTREVVLTLAFTACSCPDTMCSLLYGSKSLPGGDKYSCWCCKLGEATPAHRWWM